jgi:hypothetical protein
MGESRGESGSLPQHRPVVQSPTRRWNSLHRYPFRRENPERRGLAESALNIAPDLLEKLPLRLYLA